MLRSFARKEHPRPSREDFDDWTIGELLEEWYFDMASRIHDLRAIYGQLSAEDQQKLHDLEDVFRDGSEERASLVDLTPEESEEVWFTARETGDPLVDKWEREIAAGITPNLDEQLEDLEG